MATDLRKVLDERHLPGLDGLRAIAVFIVITYHFAPNSCWTVPGDVGVNLFFVLSGFLITWLLRKEWHRNGAISFRGFYLRRTLRIFPAYYVFLAGTAVLVSVLHRHWPPGQGLAALFYVSDYYEALHPGTSSSISHTWSLAVEEQFYLLWPLCFVFLAHRGRKALLIALSATIVAVLAWRTMLVVGTRVSLDWPYHAFDCRADSLAIGCVLAVALETDRGLAWARASARSAWLPVGVAMLLLWARGSAIHNSLGYTIEALLGAVLIVQLLQLSATRAFRWLEHPWISYLGRISYPLYLWHGLPEFASSRLPLPPPARLAIAVVGAIGLASGSYYLVERPALRLKDKLIARRASTLPAAAA